MRRLVAGLTASVLVLVSAVSATAATVSSDGRVFRYRADPGETVRLDVDYTRRFFWAEASSPVDFGPGCRPGYDLQPPPEPLEVLCPFSTPGGDVAGLRYRLSAATATTLPLGASARRSAPVTRVNTYAVSSTLAAATTRSRAPAPSTALRATTTSPASAPTGGQETTGSGAPAAFCRRWCVVDLGVTTFGANGSTADLETIACSPAPSTPTCSSVGRAETLSCCTAPMATSSEYAAAAPTRCAARRRTARTWRSSTAATALPAPAEQCRFCARDGRATFRWPLVVGAEPMNVLRPTASKQPRPGMPPCRCQGKAAASVTG